jgi:hypothetical protein
MLVVLIFFIEFRAKSKITDLNRGKNLEFLI